MITGNTRISASRGHIYDIGGSTVRGGDTLYSNGTGTGQPHKPRRRSRRHIPNSADRQSRFLAEGNAINLIEATAHALRIGWPVSYMVTINFRLGRLKRRAQDAITDFNQHARYWLTARGIPLVRVSALEHSDGGLHLHQLIHLPPHLRKDFERLAVNNWLRLSGLDPKGEQGGKVLDISDRIGGLRRFRPAQWCNEERNTYVRSVRGQLRYLLKAIDPHARSIIAPKLGTTAELLKVNPRPCEPIIGKRCGTSQNIGSTARQKAREL